MDEFSKKEEEILNFWEENKVFQKVKEKNKGKERWSFLDGPITANNPMAVHHAWGRTYKDLFQRYKALKGFDQRFQNGFDCQGLWVEVEVEKELGFKNKKDIESFGIDKFIEKCKERVRRFSKIQTEQAIRLGQFMDWENSYYTMSDDNNYSIWAFLKECQNRGLLYKGTDSVPWCPRCGTAISQHEISVEEYKEISHESIFLKFPIKENSYFLVWTTTPWTLPANVSLAVNADFDYVEKKTGKDSFILLKNKASLVEGEIIREFKGRELEGIRYKGIFDELDAVNLKEDDHRVILWEEITEEEGTGVVHIATGCGEEDYKLGKELDLSLLNPLDDESRYTKGFGFLEGKLATGVKDEIFENLKEKGLLYKTEDYLHRYPICWRCKSELIFRVVDEWYISMDKLRDRLIEVVKEINWIPSFGLDREIDWLKNMKDWLISKKRYWGLALPIFECKECGNFEVIGSKEELKERAIEGWEEFEGKSPHRPFVDKIKINCSKCNSKTERILDVGNPWLDAGIVPFSTINYSNDKEYWKEWFPVDLICESFPGQFKNWFYAIIVMSVVLEDRYPVKNIFGYSLVKDEKGEEMHKSKGNAIWLGDAIEEIGADPMRWLYARQNPVNNLRFGYSYAKEIKRKLLNLSNALTFLLTYVDKNKFESYADSPNSKNLLDSWILSRFHTLIKETELHLDKYDSMNTVLKIENFFINDLSLWYIRRSRKRIQEEEGAGEILYYILLNLSVIISPIVPFFSERIYLSLKKEGMPISVHLANWPELKEEKIDKELEEKMFKAREVINVALAKRAELGIKVRQPLKSLKIKGERMEEEIISLIREEINVKEVLFEDIKDNIELDAEITEELKKEGIDREIIRNINSLRKKMGFTPKDTIDIFSNFSFYNVETIKKETKAREIIIKEEVSGEISSEIKIDGERFYLGIRKICQ